MDYCSIMICIATRLTIARQSRFSRQTAVRTLAIPARWYTLPEAIDTLRAQRRHENWMFQASFVLNIDPRMKGHDICGALDVPNSFGSERIRRVLALTRDQDLARQALEVGAKCAGNLLGDVRKRRIQVQDYEIVVASTDIEKDLSTKGSSVKKIFSKPEMMPNTRQKTIVIPEEFVSTVERFVKYSLIQWRTTSHGIVTVPLGKVLLPTHHIVENCECLLQDIYRRRPHDFGTGPRGRLKNNGKYVLGICITMSESKALPIDLSTVRFCEHFGRGPPPYYTANGMPYPIQLSGEVDISKPRIEVLSNGHPAKPIIIKKSSSEQPGLFKATKPKKDNETIS